MDISIQEISRCHDIRAIGKDPLGTPDDLFPSNQFLAATREREREREGETSLT